MSKKNETIYEQLRRRLTEHFGQHNRIATETGVPQSTVNRIYLGEVSPRLTSVQPLLDWFAANDLGQPYKRPSAKKSAGRSGGTGNSQVVRRRAPRAASAPLR